MAQALRCGLARAEVRFPDEVVTIRHPARWASRDERSEIARYGGSVHAIDDIVVVGVIDARSLVACDSARRSRRIASRGSLRAVVRGRSWGRRGSHRCLDGCLDRCSIDARSDPTRGRDPVRNAFASMEARCLRHARSRCDATFLSARWGGHGVYCMHRRAVHPCDALVPTSGTQPDDATPH